MSEGLKFVLLFFKKENWDLNVIEFNVELKGSRLKSAFGKMRAENFSVKFLLCLLTTEKIGL